MLYITRKRNPYYIYAVPKAAKEKAHGAGSEAVLKWREGTKPQAEGAESFIRLLFRRPKVCIGFDLQSLFSAPHQESRKFFRLCLS
jgi:hypothetical protein